jgi:ubiquinol-cytochrome c reductase cytochrome c subunit
MMKTRLVIGVVCASALSGAVLSGAVPGSTAPKRTALSGPIPTAQSQPQPAPAGNVEKGRLGFVRVGCAQCHGREAQGSPTTGPRLGPSALPYAAFARYVRAPRLQMPPYTEKILSDAELADLYAFVQSRPKVTTPPALLSSEPAKPK